jgi:hypothetical protein
VEELKELSLIDFEKINPKYLKSLDGISDKIKNEVMELITSIPFIYNLVRVDRKTIKNSPKDKEGKVIVNITEPHLLENTDFFRERAIHFEKYNTYTNIYPNNHPGSDWMKFWSEESRRCLEGYVRDDGEWITGEHYWYLNYCPILKAKSKAGDIGENVYAVREEGLPEFWDGDYLYYHYRHQARLKGLHCCVLKTRRRGYSFKAASVLSLPYYHMRNQKSYAMASEGEFLYVDGLLNDKTWNQLSYIDNNTPWTQPRDYKDTEDHKRASYKDPETKTEKGRLNEIIGVTLKNNTQKARGKAGINILWEEYGVMPDGLTSWTIALGSMKQGRKVYGQMTAFGTGGTAGTPFEAMEALFYKGDSYDVYMLPNAFDKNSVGSQCAFYAGEYLNREFCFDKEGNSNPIKALVEIVSEWKTKDAIAIVQFKADYSITPQDACLRKEGSIFPITLLNEVLSEILPRYRSFVSEHHIGKIGLDSFGNATWNNSTTDAPIHDFPMKDNKNKYGAIEIFKLPVKLSSGEIPHGRYIAASDPYDDDSSTTTSLGSIFIMDTFTDEIVAEYTGRPHTAVEFYDIVYRMLKFYNATCLYEAFNKGLFAYMDRKNSLHLLADNPKILKQMDYIKGDMYGNKKKGYPPSKGVNAWGRRLLADWLISSPQMIDEDRPDLTNAHKVRSIGALRELIGWNSDGNFDRVSALQALMIYREERAKYAIDMQEEEVNPNDFFIRNYKPARNRYAIAIEQYKKSQKQ